MKRKIISVLLVLVLIFSVFTQAVSADVFWKNGGLSVEGVAGYSDMGNGFTYLNVSDARGYVDAPDLDTAPYYLLVGVDGQIPSGHWEILHISRDERNRKWNPAGAPEDIYISFPNAGAKNITVNTKAKDETVMEGVPFMPKTAYLFKFAKEDNALAVYCNGVLVFKGADQLEVFSGDKLWFTTDGNIGDNDTFNLCPMFICPDFKLNSEPDVYFTTGPKSGCNGYSSYITDVTAENMTATYDGDGYVRVMIDSVHNDAGNPSQVGESVSGEFSNPNRRFEICVIPESLVKGNWCTVGVYDPSDGEKSFAQSQNTLRFNISNGGYGKLGFFYEYDKEFVLIPSAPRVEIQQKSVIALELYNDTIKVYYNDILENVIYKTDPNTAALFDMMNAPRLRAGIVGSKNTQQADVVKLKINNATKMPEFISVAMKSGASLRLSEPAGLRFEACISGLDRLYNAAQPQVGMVIAPIGTAMDVADFTKEQLDIEGKKYLDIKGSILAGENADTIRAVISNIKDDNIECEFSACAYVILTFSDGTKETVYSDVVSATLAQTAYNIKYSEDYEKLNNKEKQIVDKFAYCYSKGDKYDRYETVSFSDYDTGDDDTALAAAIDFVKQQRAADALRYERVEYTLKMPTDRYEFENTILFYSVEDLIVDGQGSDFIFTKNVSAILMDNCKNVKFKNFNIDYDPLRYTQGVITAIDGLKCTVEIDEGYPYDIDFINGAGVDDVYGEAHFGEQTFTINIHDRTGAVKPNTPTYVFRTNAVSLGGRTVQIEAHSNSLFEGSPVDYMNVGDAVSISFVGPKLLWAERGRGGMELVNINVYSTPGAGFWELDGEGGTLYKNVCVAPGPKPEGATRERLLAMSGDCIHSSMLKKGPTVDGCTFTNLADDALNINGLVYYVVSSVGNKTVVAPRWNYPFYVGERLNGYDGTDLFKKGDGKVIQITSRNDVSLTETIKALYSDKDQQWGDNTLVYDVITDKPLNLEYGDIITSNDRRCSGAVIKNSTFGLNRSRGIVVKGDDILIENNTIMGTMFPSIAVQLDTGFGESGFSSNVVIRSNHIINGAVGKDMTRPINRENLGAIMVNILLDRGHNGLINNFEHKNIVIEDNIVESTAVYGISCVNVDGLTVRNNRVCNPFMFGVGAVGQNFDISPEAGIFIGQCRNVYATDNTVAGGPEEITQAVQMHSSVTDIKQNSNNIKE